MERAKEPVEGRNDRNIKSSFLHKPTYLLQALEKEKACQFEVCRTHKANIVEHFQGKKDFFFQFPLSYFTFHMSCLQSFSFVLGGFFLFANSLRIKTGFHIDQEDRGLLVNFSSPFSAWLCVSVSLSGQKKTLFLLGGSTSSRPSGCSPFTQRLWRQFCF